MRRQSCTATIICVCTAWFVLDLVRNKAALQPSSVSAQPGLCWTLSETKLHCNYLLCLHSPVCVGPCQKQSCTATIFCVCTARFVLDLVRNKAALQPSSVFAQPGLCWTLSETKLHCNHLLCLHSPVCVGPGQKQSCTATIFCVCTARFVLDLVRNKAALQPSSVSAQPGLCWPWSETKLHCNHLLCLHSPVCVGPGQKQSCTATIFCVCTARFVLDLVRNKAALQPSSVSAQPGLCWTLSETKLQCNHLLCLHSPVCVGPCQKQSCTATIFCVCTAQFVLDLVRNKAALQPSSVSAQPGLCWTWSETKLHCNHLLCLHSPVCVRPGRKQSCTATIFCVCTAWFVLDLVRNKAALQPSSVSAQPGLCWTWSETKLPSKLQGLATVLIFWI